MGVGWTKMGLWARPEVPNVAGVACVVSSRPISMQDGMFLRSHPVGLRPRALSTSVAQSSHGGVSSIL